MEGKLWVRESFVNETEGYRFGDSDTYETYTDDLGRLFKDMQREYGRCISKSYVDAEGGPRQVGWVFEKWMQYEDAPDYYTRSVWVEVFTVPPQYDRVLVDGTGLHPWNGGTR